MMCDWTCVQINHCLKWSSLANVNYTNKHAINLLAGNQLHKLIEEQMQLKCSGIDFNTSNIPDLSLSLFQESTMLVDGKTTTQL